MTVSFCLPGKAEGRLIVHPDHQRRGIGTELRRQIEARFPAAGCFELFTGHKSVKNIRLYERLGYHLFMQEPVNNKLTLVFLEKATEVVSDRLTSESRSTPA